MNESRHFKILGIFWLIVGGMLTIGVVIGLWQMWKTPDLPFSVFVVVGSIWVFALSGVAIINGWGLLSRKRWARMATIILSSFLLFYSLSSLFLVEVDGGEHNTPVEVLLIILLFMMGLYGLWVMLSKRGLEKRYGPMEKTSSGLKENVAGLLCYVVGWISGLVFFLLKPGNRFVRFHALQSIIVFGIINIVSIVFSSIPIVSVIVGSLVGLLAFVLWVVLMVKAYQGERFKLPWAGNLAERWANKQTK